MSDLDNRQITELVRRGLPPIEFVRAFVELFAGTIGADLGVAWNCQKTPCTPICQVTKDTTKVVSVPFSSERHEQLLLDVFQQHTVNKISPHIDQPTQPVVLLGPIQRESLFAIVEFILPAEKSETESRRSLELLAEWCRIANENTEVENDSDNFPQVIDSEFSPADNFPQVTDSEFSPADNFSQVTGQLDAKVFAQFSSRIHESLDFEETAANVANETRRALDCDRVTVLRRNGRTFHVVAISGQPTVNQRSNVVRSLRTLANAVLATKQTFWLPTDRPIPAQIEQPLHEYLELSMTRSLVVLPVFETTAQESIVPETIAHAANATLPNEKQSVIAGLVIEQANMQWKQNDYQPKIDSVVENASCALRNAHAVSSIFLYPLWRTLGKTKPIFYLRNVRKLWIGFGSLLLLTLVMFLVPANFQLGCDGELVPVARRKIFADQPGTVVSVQTQHGEVVSQGDVLLQMENDELEIQIEQLSGERLALEQRLKGSRSIRISRQGREQDGEVEIGQKEIQSQIDSLQRRLETIREKRIRLKVVSPLDGQVLTWDIANRLQNRPVQPGDLLIEVADTTGSWQLELDLANRKVGHLKQAMARNENPLPVRFTMSADPRRVFSGTISEVATATSVNREMMQSLRIKVDVDANEFAELKQVGSKVSAKIQCGPRRMGFVWFHEVWEFLQYRVVFRFW